MLQTLNTRAIDLVLLGVLVQQRSLVVAVDPHQLFRNRRGGCRQLVLGVGEGNFNPEKPQPAELVTAPGATRAVLGNLGEAERRNREAEKMGSEQGGKRIGVCDRGGRVRLRMKR